MARETGMIYYSKSVAGSRATHRLPVRFDWSDGCLGIDQRDSETGRFDRVLLSPRQIKAMFAFVKEHSPSAGLSQEEAEP